MILSGKTLRSYAERGIPLVSPFVSEKTIFNGMSYGCSVAGYDIRVMESTVIDSKQFQLISSIEKFQLPKNVVGFVHDKSSWARRGLSFFNTVIEPGWEGYLTLEAYNTSKVSILLVSGSPIAQIIFMYTDEETEGYDGKYQNQGRGPQAAINELARA